MPRGGARAGAGRKKGAATTKTREIADRIVAEGASPLEVMMEAMRMHLAAARGEEISHLEEIDKAAAIAKDAAPYIHPRLSQTQDTTEKKQIIVIRGGFLDKDEEP